MDSWQHFDNTFHWWLTTLYTDTGQSFHWYLSDILLRTVQRFPSITLGLPKNRSFQKDGRKDFHKTYNNCHKCHKCHICQKTWPNVKNSPCELKYKLMSGTSQWTLFGSRGSSIRMMSLSKRLSHMKTPQTPPQGSITDMGSLFPKRRFDLLREGSQSLHVSCQM